MRASRVRSQDAAIVQESKREVHSLRMAVPGLFAASKGLSKKKKRNSKLIVHSIFYLFFFISLLYNIVVLFFSAMVFRNKPGRKPAFMEPVTDT
jgi:predicted membrane metal-binding protein